MRKTILVGLVLSIIIIPFTINAQIPNNGFELWEDYPDPANPANVYQKPDLWNGLLPTSPSVYSFSIEKNADSYPAGTGDYSMLIKSDTANGVEGVALSFDSFPSNLSPQSIPPAFAINFRPTSLCLYYKYLPADNDTMRVLCSFYKNGIIIGDAEFTSPDNIPNWTPLIIPVNFFTSDIPDSATIMLATFSNIQHGVSKLYVDNLSFDTHITFVEEGVSVSPPKSYGLRQNYPNPFNPETLIQYALTEESQVKLEVYNIAGKRVATLVDEVKQAGYYTVAWNGRNDLGRPVSAGSYFCRIQAEGYSHTIRMILQK